LLGLAMTVSDLTEAELIERIRSRLKPPPAWMLVGIGDDAAVVEPERNRLEVLSVDALVEGVHFDRAFTPPAAIGHRALAVNLSDLAAMGATPRLALLSLALPDRLVVDDFDALVDGLAGLAARTGVAVAGGNLTKSPGPLMLDVTVAGTLKRRGALLRSGASAGDDVYVSGAIGAAAAGLQMLRMKISTTEDAEDTEVQAEPKNDLSRVSSVSSVVESCIHRFLYPEPRLRLGTLLGRNRVATACIDLSDGLADGVRRITEASGVGATIDAHALPIDPEARRWFTSRRADPIAAALTGGDDYELVFTASPRVRKPLHAACRSAGVSVTRIGACTADRAIVLHGADTDAAWPRGYSHFR
jgi:thiamine-monophosphate kinase